jgi:hypothetical protein
MMARDNISTSITVLIILMSLPGTSRVPMIPLKLVLYSRVRTPGSVVELLAPVAEAQVQIPSFNILTK